MLETFPSNHRKDFQVRSVRRGNVSAGAKETEAKEANSLSPGDREDGISRPNSLSDDFYILEPNFREELLRFFNGIEAINGHRETGNRMQVFLRSEDEDKSEPTLITRKISLRWRSGLFQK
jgi:hypothetical protein